VRGGVVVAEGRIGRARAGWVRGPGVDVDVDCGDREGVGEDVGAEVRGEGEKAGDLGLLVLSELLAMGRLLDLSGLLALGGLMLTLVFLSIKELDGGEVGYELAVWKHRFSSERRAF
jgi:hypothetical protein